MMKASLCSCDLTSGRQCSRYRTTTSGRTRSGTSWCSGPRDGKFLPKSMTYALKRENTRGQQRIIHDVLRSRRPQVFFSMREHWPNVGVGRVPATIRDPLYEVIELKVRTQPRSCRSLGRLNPLAESGAGFTSDRTVTNRIVEGRVPMSLWAIPYRPYSACGRRA